MWEKILLTIDVHIPWQHSSPGAIKKPHGGNQTYAEMSRITEVHVQGGSCGPGIGNDMCEGAEPEWAAVGKNKIRCVWL